MSFRERLTRRGVLEIAALMTATAASARAQPPTPLSEMPPPRARPSLASMPVRLTVNGSQHELLVDPRTSLLDALRENLGLSGTKKGCDHGQCGACTVLVNGSRRNACMSLAVARDGDEIVTVEGLAGGERLHDLQTAFVRQDAFQCGYCTPGQICSAVGMLGEIGKGVPSAVSADLRAAPALTVEEIRERMSGNICRCAAYPNIVAAIMSAGTGRPT
jgi:xanthine dehydrogenase YagT iron-sulfur-binding subunit